METALSERRDTATAGRVCCGLEQRRSRSQEITVSKDSQLKARWRVALARAAPILRFLRSGDESCRLQAQWKHRKERTAPSRPPSQWISCALWSSEWNGSKKKKRPSAPTCAKS